MTWLIALALACFLISLLDLISLSLVDGLTGRVGMLALVVTASLTTPLTNPLTNPLNAFVLIGVLDLISLGLVAVTTSGLT